MIDLKNILTLAKAATPGPWTVDTCGDVITRAILDTDTDECKAFGGPLFRMIGTTPTAPYNPDGIFIAAANPSTIISLIERIEAAERVIEFYADEMGYEFGDLPYPEVHTDSGKKAREYWERFK